MTRFLFCVVLLFVGLTLVHSSPFIKKIFGHKFGGQPRELKENQKKDKSEKNCAQTYFLIEFVPYPVPYPYPVPFHQPQPFGFGGHGGHGGGGCKLPLKFLSTERFF
jgi:hypothetical protein